MVFATLTIEVVRNLEIASSVSEGFPMVLGFTDCLCHRSPTAVDLHQSDVGGAVAVGFRHDPFGAPGLAPHDATSPVNGEAILGE